MLRSWPERRVCNSPREFLGVANLSAEFLFCPALIIDRADVDLDAGLPLLRIYHLYTYIADLELSPLAVDTE